MPAVFVTSLLKQACYGFLLTSLLQRWLNRLVPSCWQACYDCKFVGNNFATALSEQPCYSIVRTTLLHDGQQIATSLLEQAVTSSANTTCWQVVGTTLLQVCCKFVTKFCLFTCVVDTAGSSKTFNLRVWLFIQNLLTLIKTRSFILNSYFTHILLSFSLNVHGFLFLSEGNSSICTSLDW